MSNLLPFTAPFVIDTLLMTLVFAVLRLRITAANLGIVALYVLGHALYESVRLSLPSADILANGLVRLIASLLALGIYILILRAWTNRTPSGTSTTSA